MIYGDLKWRLCERTILALLIQCESKVRLMHPYALNYSEIYALVENSFGALWPLTLSEFESVPGSLVKRDYIAYNFVSLNGKPGQPTDEERARGGFTITPEGRKYLEKIELGDWPDKQGRFSKQKAGQAA